MDLRQRTQNRNGSWKKDYCYRIATINASTLRDKEEEVAELMKERNLDILGICETRYLGEGIKAIHDGFILIYKGRDDERKHGVAIVFKAELYKKVTETFLVNERIMAVTMKIAGETLSVIQVYAPQQGRPQEEKQEFLQTLENTYDSVNGTTKILIGDMNAHMGLRREGEEEVIGSWGLGDRNLDGERLLDFAMRNGLAVMNTFFEHRDTQKWTWYRWSRHEGRYTEKSMIDLVLANDKRIFKDVKSIPSVSLDADHRLVMGKMRWMKKPKTPKVNRERYVLENLKDVKLQFNQKLEDLREDANVMTETDIEDVWRAFKDGMDTAAKETIGVKRVSAGRR